MNTPALHLRPEDYTRSQWKNGLGWTDQIAIHPVGADLRRADFLWRVSTAQVAQSAPFSVFPEHDRLLIVLEGAGVRLSHSYDPDEDPEVVDLSPLEPYEFPGDITTRCDLLEGPIQDFSVFFRKGIVSAQAEIILTAPSAPYEWKPESYIQLLFVAEGSVRIGDEVLDKGDSFRLDRDHGSLDAEIETLMIEAVSGSEEDPARLVLVRLDPVG